MAIIDIVNSKYVPNGCTTKSKKDCLGKLCLLLVMSLNNLPAKNLEISLLKIRVTSMVPNTIR